MTIWLISLLSTLTLAGEALPPAPRPSPAVEQAARQYRIEIYNRYHNDRAEYNRRIAIGQEIFKQYEDTCFEASPLEVTNWYIAAARQSTTGGEIAPRAATTIIAAKPRGLPTDEVAKVEIVYPKTSAAVTSTNKATTPAQQEPVIAPAEELPTPAVEIEYPTGVSPIPATSPTAPTKVLPLAVEKAADLIDTFFQSAKPTPQPTTATDVDPFQP